METIVARPVGLRMTTGALMIWVGVIGLVLGLIRGDAVDWLPVESLGWVAGVVGLATAGGMPWLSRKMAEAPDVHQKLSRFETRAERLIVAGLVSLFAATAVGMGWLLLAIVRP